jgi:hypothetical protein
MAPSLIYTLYGSLQHTFISVCCVFMAPLLGSGFQQHRFPLLLLCSVAPVFAGWRLTSNCSYSRPTKNSHLVSSYSLSLDRTEKRAPDNAVSCCISICCSGNVFIEPLPHSGQCRRVTMFTNVEEYCFLNCD